MGSKNKTNKKQKQKTKQKVCPSLPDHEVGSRPEEITLWNNNILKIIFMLVLF